MAAEDDSLMNRFDRAGLRRFSARDAVLATAFVTVLLILFAGQSVRHQGEQMSPGIGRDIVLGVGKPTGWVADRLPLAHAAHDATAWLSPDEALSSDGSFSKVQTASAKVPPVTAAAFDPAQLGAKPPAKKPLKTLLVTGDSMSMPLDEELGRALAPRGVKVIRDPHLGTGISKTFLVDWGQLAASQVSKDTPDAEVVFIGANEGFPMNGVNCCSAQWAAIYANRVRAMMNTYRRNGRAKVFWVTVPMPRSKARAGISRVVNAAVEVAAQPWRSQVRIVDTPPIFTPKGYRDAMPIDGKDTIVRQSDGIHLNEAGSALLAKAIVSRLSQDFTFAGG